MHMANDEGDQYFERHMPGRKIPPPPPKPKDEDEK